MTKSRKQHKQTPNNNLGKVSFGKNEELMKN